MYFWRQKRYLFWKFSFLYSRLKYLIFHKLGINTTYKNTKYKKLAHSSLKEDSNAQQWYKKKLSMGWNREFYPKSSQFTARSDNIVQYITTETQ